MLTLLLKELRSFLNSLIGYMVIMVFLVTISLLLWVFPGPFNVFDSGTASLSPLFELGAWMFLFLGPAITMRSFSEEKRTGTIEMLLTKPISDWQLIYAKYFAGYILVIFSLAPTLIYYLCIHLLAGPVGNVDTGAMWGSYIGLLLLAGGFISIGLFASSISDNQIISFILALFISLICFVGFELFSFLEILEPVQLFATKLGMYDHYLSISRGVLDTRDLIYFLSVIALFLFLTKIRLESRKW